MEPLPEGFDIGEDVSRVGLREETVVGGDEERGSCKAEIEEPVDSYSC